MVKIKGGLEKILEKKSPYYVYVLKCEKKGCFYVGYTNNLLRRMKEHEKGNGSEFTKVYGIDEVIYLEPHKSKEKAIERETLVTLECMYNLQTIDRVGGGKYPGVIKSFSERKEIIKTLTKYAKKINS